MAKQFLSAWDNPASGIRKIPEQLTNSELRRALIAYYQAATNNVSAKEKFLIELSFGYEDRLPEAIALGEETVKAFPHDIFMNYYLGTLLIVRESYGRALEVLSNPEVEIPKEPREVELSMMIQRQAQLDFAAMLVGRMDIVKSNLIPLANATPAAFESEMLRFNAAVVLTVYSITEHDKLLFAKATALARFDDREYQDAIDNFLRVGCYVMSKGEWSVLESQLLKQASRPLTPEASLVESHISSAESDKIRSVISQSESGTADLYALVRDQNLEKVFIAYFENTTNAVPVKERLALARCFGIEGRLSDAYKLAQEYLQAFPNDWRGWRVCGLAAYNGRSLETALASLTNAIAIGGDQARDLSYPATVCSFWMGRLEISDNLTDFIVKQKDSRNSSEEQCNIALLLIFVSISKSDSALFVKTMKGLTPSQIMSNLSLRCAVLTAWTVFQPKELAQFWKAYQTAAFNERPKLK